MKTIKTKTAYSGTSGLVLPVANKNLYPGAFADKSRLTYYASLFNSVEINSSFKKVPRASTIERWAASVPKNFQFTFKCPGGITHIKELIFVPEDVTNFFQVINAVGKNKGCLLVQFPGKLNIEYTKPLEKLLKIIRQTDPKNQWKVAIEFRNVSWYHQDIYDLLQANSMSMVLHDMPSSAPLLTGGKSDFVYVRFHGTDKGYRGSYSDEVLLTYAQFIKTWKNEGKDVYVYFNNTLGNAVNNLITLNGFIDTPL